MKRNTFKTILLSLAFMAAGSATLNANAHDRYPPAQLYSRPAPVQFYDYVYYPSHQVYFSPRARTWYWSEGAQWRSGVRLPFGININIGGLPVQLRSALPYYDHVYVEQRYGRPWRAAHYRYDRREHRDRDDRYDGRFDRNDRDFRHDRDDQGRRHDGHHRW